MPAKFFDPSHTLLFVALFFYVEGLKFMQPYQNLGTLKFHILECVSFSPKFYSDHTKIQVHTLKFRILVCFFFTTISFKMCPLV